MRLLGRNPNQAPANQFLGKLAFKDKLNLSDIDDIDDNTLPAIDSIVNTNTVVASFIYDTSKDSDNGAWTTQSRHTSWYNETLNTATRGATRDFPRVALIVAESNKVTIYDATDSSCPMWMVFNGAFSWTTGVVHYTGIGIVAVAIKNGVLHVADGDISFGIDIIDFITEDCVALTSSVFWGGYARTNIEGRNGPTYYLTGAGVGGLPTIKSGLINALAVTQDASGNNIVYVGSNGGLDRIYKGAVSSWTDNGGGRLLVLSVGIIGDYVYWVCNNNAVRGFTILKANVSDTLTPSNSTTDTTYTGSGTWSSTTTPIQYGGESSYVYPKNTIAHNAIATNRSLTQILPNPSSWGNGLINTTTDTSISGYQYGDIKGAFLGSNVAETLSGTELVTNGDFASWTSDDPDSFTITNTEDVNNYITEHANGARIVSNGNVIGLWQYVSGLTIGKSYNFVVAKSDHVDGRIRLVITNSDRATITDIDGSDTNGTYLFTFVPTNATCSIYIYRDTTGSTDYVINSWSVKEATPDHSYNNNALSVAGSVDFAPVNTGSELCAASDFSTSNYLYQPYNSDLDFGTGDFYVMGWVNSSVNTAETILNRQTSGVDTNRILIDIINGDYFRIVCGATLNDSTITMTENIWVFVVFARTSGVMKIYQNAVEILSEANTADVTDTTAETRIGLRVDGTSPLTNGSIALLRIGAGAPTAAMIKKMYDDEKHLFQENAQWSLPALDVKAVDYDESNGLLTCGTASGYVRKSGLINVDSGTGDASVISTESGILSQGNN